jgi:hypothetical protein
MTRSTAPAALLFGLAATAASAQAVTSPRFNTSISGFMNLGLSYVDSAETDADDGNRFIISNNAEVHFNFSLVADNGLTFGAKVEFEANGSNANVDEYVGWVQGSFGRVEVGAEDGAADILGRGLPGGVFSAAANDDGVLFDLASTGVVEANAFGADTGDSLKVNYYSPTFAGFRAGLSLVPNGTEGPVASAVETTAGRGMELGAQWRGEFSGISLRLNSGATLFDEGDSVAVARDYAFTLGASVGYAGFQVGVGFGQTEADDGTDQVIGFGAQYNTGPWMFGVQYGQRLDARPTRVRAASGANPAVFETFDDSYTLSGEIEYRLAPGVTTGFTVEHASDSFSTSGPYTGTEAAYSGSVFLLLAF